jgi:carbonic anhydrase/acetyltransferase-like protein (isoleucine patch superfamily)
VIRRLNGHVPVIGPGAFVHDAAEVIGRVRLGTSVRPPGGIEPIEAHRGERA